jgi:hypothetical protein
MEWHFADWIIGAVTGEALALAVSTVRGYVNKKREGLHGTGGTNRKKLPTRNRRPSRIPEFNVFARLAEAFKKKNPGLILSLRV